MSDIQTTAFVEAVQPLIQRKDMSGLVALLKRRWTSDEIVKLLSCGCCDTRKLAALSLSLVGDRDSIRPLAERLRDPDPVVNEMAEHALWSIWFRSSTPEANHEVCRGTQDLNRREFVAAIEHFDEAIAIDPEFAEAYNQRAIAEFLQERFEASIADCRETVARMPCHFGAWAGMGHGYLHLGQFRRAIECYCQALDINPHLDCLRQTVAELHSKIGKPDSPHC